MGRFNKIPLSCLKEKVFVSWKKNLRNWTGPLSRVMSPFPALQTSLMPCVLVNYVRFQKYNAPVTAFLFAVLWKRRAASAPSFCARARTHMSCMYEWGSGARRETKSQVEHRFSFSFSITSAFATSFRFDGPCRTILECFSYL